MNAEKEALLDHFDECKEMFDTKIMLQRIKPIHWDTNLTEYLNEVKEELEKNTYDNKKSVLSRWITWLQGRYPTTALVNEYTTIVYQSNKSTRSRNAREIVYFSNRYLALHGKPLVSICHDLCLLSAFHI